MDRDSTNDLHALVRSHAERIEQLERLVGVGPLASLPEEHFTVAQLAGRFGVKVRTVYQWIWRYGLDHVRLGRRVYIPRREVDRLIDRNDSLAGWRVVGHNGKRDQ